MELSQSQQSEDPDSPGVKLVDTPNSNDEGELGLSRHMDLPTKLGTPAGLDFILSGLDVCGFILLSPLQEFGSSGLGVGSLGFAELLESLVDLLVSLLLLPESFGLGGNYLIGHNLIQILIFIKIFNIPRTPLLSPVQNTITNNPHNIPIHPL